MGFSMSSAALYPEILRQEGFQCIGHLDYRLHITAWWHPAAEKLLQILVVDLGTCAILKGDKSYYLQSVTAEGETWARDIGLLHDYLENHFPEVRISFSHFRDVSPALAQAEVCRRLSVESPTQPIPSVESLAELQRQLHAKRRGVADTARLLALSKTAPDLLSGYAYRQTRTQEAQIGELEEKIMRQRERLSLLQNLQREYERKGSAAVYCFSISSSVQIAADSAQFRDALHAVVKELTDHHRYQVKQKLQGGCLHIQVAEAQEPVIAWVEQWLGGALSPMQVHRLSPAFELLRTAAAEHMIVTPDEPIVVDGHERQAEKHLAARFLSTVMNRLDKTETDGHKGSLDPKTVPPDALPLRIGLRTDEKGRPIEPAVLPLAQAGHTYISGTTGSGKSYLARALVEESAQYKELSVLVLDPRNQYAGLLAPEDRPPILAQYKEFGMKPNLAHGFAFSYFAPALACAPQLPQELSFLASGKSIVSFKGMDDRQRCSLAGRILDAAFDSLSTEESEHPRLLVLVDEAHLLTRRRVDESAKEAAAQAERALDKIAREGRKYGIVLVLVSQTAKDFSYDLASLRQMTNTKVFLRNSDREIEYASDIIGDGRLLVQLPTGTALLYNANWGLHRIRVRPPYSKVYELSEAEIRRYLGSANGQIRPLTNPAREFLSVIKQFGTPPNPPLNTSRAASLAGITSKRRLHELLTELEHAGAISTRKLHERGRPRIIDLTIQSAGAMDRIPDASGQNPGTSD
jgi:hypothetical protein